MLTRLGYVNMYCKYFNVFSYSSVSPKNIRLSSVSLMLLFEPCSHLCDAAARLERPLTQMLILKP